MADTVFGPYSGIVASRRAVSSGRCHSSICASSRSTSLASVLSWAARLLSARLRNERPAFPAAYVKNTLRMIHSEGDNLLLICRLLDVDLRRLIHGANMLMQGPTTLSR